MDVKNELVLIGVAALAVWVLGKKYMPNIDPTDSDNVINRGVTSVYRDVTGSTGTIGTDLYDVTHDGTFNPTSDNNLIYKGVSGIGSAVSGSNDWSLGGALYDMIH